MTDETVHNVICGLTDRAWGVQDERIYRPIPLNQIPIAKDWRELEKLNNNFGQKVIYQELVDYYGREETIKILSRIIVENVVRIQIHMLTTERKTNV